MGYRRLFIMRKDLHMGAGKLAAQVGHCCEAYWTNWFKRFASGQSVTPDGKLKQFFEGCIDKSIYDEYVSGIFTKTICEAKKLI